MCRSYQQNHKQISPNEKKRRAAEKKTSRLCFRVVYRVFRYVHWHDFVSFRFMLCCLNRQYVSLVCECVCCQSPKCWFKIVPCVIMWRSDASSVANTHREKEDIKTTGRKKVHYTDIHIQFGLAEAKKKRFDTCFEYIYCFAYINTDVVFGQDSMYKFIYIFSPISNRTSLRFGKL